MKIAYISSNLSERAKINALKMMIKADCRDRLKKSRQQELAAGNNIKSLK